LQKERKNLSIKSASLDLLLSFLWGGHPTALKIAIPYAPPIRQGWMRFAVSGIVIFFWARYKKISF